MSTVDVVVVGGGVAGLSALVAFSARGSALLLERETSLFAHASGRNAAIYRPLEDDSTTAQLARRSLALFDALGGEPVLARSGLLFVSADRAPLLALVRQAGAQAVASEWLERARLSELASSLAGGDAEAGVLVPEGGVLDIAAMTRVLSRTARERGAETRCGERVVRVRVEGDCVHGVELASGERIAAGRVVLAAGAWSAVLGQRCGAELPLSPLRRHLVELDAAPLPARHPVVWRVDDEFYFRAAPGGVLASPCDEAAAMPAAREPADPVLVERLRDQLARTAPALATARVKEAWACLRTFAPDRELCVGEDPRVRGLYWLTGLGGRGMAVGPAAGEMLAALAHGQPHPLAGVLSPARLAR